MSEANYSFTTKVGNDLFTVRGNTVDEFNQNLSNAAIGETLTYTRGLQDAIRGERQTLVAAQQLEATIEPTVISQPVSQVATPPTQAPQEESHAIPPTPLVTIPTCSHGQRTFREGVSQYGTWQAWFCPTPKGQPDQCEGIFIPKTELLTPEQVASLG